MHLNSKIKMKLKFTRHIKFTPHKIITEALLPRVVDVNNYVKTRLQRALWKRYTYVFVCPRYI